MQVFLRTLAANVNRRSIQRATECQLPFTAHHEVRRAGLQVESLKSVELDKLQTIFTRLSASYCQSKIKLLQG